MKRHFAALMALLVLIGTSPASAQRAPLYGVWVGGMQCGRYIRVMQLFMYGNGTGLLLLGISPFTPDVKPAVAMVSLRQPPEYDYVLIDRWISNGAEPRPQLAGRLGADGVFEGHALGDARCDDLFLRPRAFVPALLQGMARSPLVAAQREARKLDPPQMTAADMIATGLFAFALLGGMPNTATGGNGGRRFAPAVTPDDNSPVFRPPSVGGDVHGNQPRTNVQ